MKWFNKILLSLLVIFIGSSVFSPIGFAIMPGNVSGITLENDIKDSNTSKAPTTTDDWFEAGFIDSACAKPVISDDVKTNLNTFKKEEANMAEKFITDSAMSLFNIGDVNGLATLVFGNPYCVWNNKLLTETPPMSANGVFSQPEMDQIVTPLMKVFGSCMSIALTLAAMIAGLKLMVKSVKGGAALSEFWDTAGWWFIAIVVAVSYPLLIQILFSFNTAIVLAFRDMLLSVNPKALSGFSVMGTWSDFLTAGSLLSYLFVVVAEWILAVILNIIYIARKITILILLVMGIIAIYSLLFPRTRSFFINWFKELCSNIFLQSIHALVFFVVLQFVNLGAGVFFKLVMMMMFIPISGMISKWLNMGDGSSKMGNAAALMGVGGVFSTYMLATQAGNVLRGGSMMASNLFNSTVNGGSGGGGGGGGQNILNNAIKDNGSTAISNRATGNSNSPVFNTVKSAMERAGSLVGGVGGIVGGPAFSAIASRVGSSVGGGIVQVPRNIATSVQGVKQAFNEAKQYAADKGLNGIGALFSKASSSNVEDLAQRRKLMQNLGEGVGVAFGQRAASMGRALGAGLSGVSNQRIHSANMASLGITGGNALQALSKSFPGAPAKFIQTNGGSALMVDTGNGFKQVGVTGAADPSLGAGQTRVVDYSLGNPSLNYNLQPNNTYKPDLSKVPLSDAPIGLAGSTDNILRTSGAYIASGTDNTSFDKTVATLSNATKVSDNSFVASSINPESYIYSGSKLASVSTSDKLANNIQSTNANVASWINNASKLSLKNRRIS